MKKIILSISIVLLLVLCVMTAVTGLPMLGIKSIPEIQQEDEKIDATIASATKVASTDYNTALENIKENLKKLQDEKKSYEEALDAVSTTDEEGKKTIITAQKYEIEYLWAVVGNHARSEGVEIKMDLKSGVSSELYNLEFTVRGEYIEISDFVASLENDSVLGFKIEDFKLLPGGGENSLEATFICKNIQIKEVANTNSSSSTNTTNTTTNTNQTTQQNTGTVTQNNTTTQQGTSNTATQQVQNSGTTQGTNTNQTQGTQNANGTTSGNGQVVTQIQ